MKHKHYEMIVAKAESMGLVCFVKRPDVEWVKCDDRILPCIDEHEYFLCLPQHKEAVLHSLNGGEAVSDSGDGDWCLSSTELWRKDWWYMCESYESKVKPKKEKRWIVCSPNHNDVNETLFHHKPDMNNFDGCCQLIEIEVEVKL
jgi:hypothetical protein